MTVYRAKLIIERIEVGRPALRSQPTKEVAVYDELRMELTADTSDLALNKVVNLAIAEQDDRLARRQVESIQDSIDGAMGRKPIKKAASEPPITDDYDEEEEED